MTQPGSRRSFMRHLGIGGAAAIGAAAVPGALVATAASADTGGSSSSAGGSSSSSKSTLPTGDLDLLQFGEGLEVAAQRICVAAVDRRLLSSAQSEMCRTFAEHHHAHALSLATAAGRTLDTLVAPDATVLAAQTSLLQAAGSADGVLGALYAFEERLAATYQAMLGQLATTTAASLAARVGAVDAQQAAALGQQLGLPTSDWMPTTQGTTGAYTPTGA